MAVQIGRFVPTARVDQLKRVHFSNAIGNAFWRFGSCAHFLLLVGCLLLNQSAVSAQQEELEDAAQNSVQTALVQFVRPGYRQLTTTTLNLEDKVGAYCSDPSANRLKEARDAFSEAVTSWGRIEMVRFGPILINNRLERFLFYPDRRGRGLKQVQTVLATEDETASEVETLRKKSVALQGFGALEYALFGRGSDDAGNGGAQYRCRFAHAVSQNLNRMAADINEAWSGDSELLKAWTEFGPQNYIFNNGKEALSHLLSTIVHGLETAREVRLAAFLKDVPEKDRPRSAILWRSESTLPILHANVQSIADLFDKAELDNAIPKPSREEISNDIRDRFSALIQSMKLYGPIAELLVEDDSRTRLIDIDRQLEELIAIFYGRYAQAVGLRVGFFSEDGD